MPIPLCEHVMSSGIRCGSPALRGQTHCHYHTSIRTLLPKRFIAHERFRNEYDHGCRLFPMPLLEDATAIQTALMQVIHATLEGAIHFRSASIVLSALRTAQRNLALVKLEMAATSAAAMERELPSDARQKAEMTWPNRPDDEWPTSYIGRSTVSPAHLNGDLGYREPKIPPDPEDEPASQTVAEAAPQGDRPSSHSTDVGAAGSAPRGDQPSVRDPDAGTADVAQSDDSSHPASASPSSHASGAKAGTNVEGVAAAHASGEKAGTNVEAAAAPARKPPLPFPAAGLREQDEPRQEGRTQPERSD